MAEKKQVFLPKNDDVIFFEKEGTLGYDEHKMMFYIKEDPVRAFLSFKMDPHKKDLLEFVDKYVKIFYVESKYQKKNQFPITQGTSRKIYKLIVLI